MPAHGKNFLAREPAPKRNTQRKENTMPLLNAVAPPKPGVAGPVLTESNGNLYLRWQDAAGNISDTYALTLQLDPDGSGVRGILYNDCPPQFKTDANGFFVVVQP
jgi:hypothetical protein